MNHFEADHSTSASNPVEPLRYDAAASAANEAAAFRAALAESLIFSHLAADERDGLLEAGDVQRLAAGETVFRSGDPATRVYCVLTGSVAIETPGSGFVLNRLQPGETFGEIGVIEGRPRTATVRAWQPCAVLAIDQADFLGLLVSHPGIAFRLVATLARRLNHLTEFIGGCCDAGGRSGIA